MLKVSYFALFAAPWIAKYDLLVAITGLSTWMLIAAYFASLALALANLLYDTSCPVIVKRFASPADLYKEMLEIKLLSRTAYPLDEYDASVMHCKTAYYHALDDHPLRGSACAFLFLLAGILGGLVLVVRSVSVMLFAVGY